MPEPRHRRPRPRRSCALWLQAPVRLSTVAAVLFTTLASAAQTPTSPTTLAQLRDTYRPLLLFAPSPEDPALQAQLHKLKDNAPGLHERDVLLIAIPFHNPAPTDTSLTPEDATAARRRFGIAPADFTVLLLGKDGGEKFRSTKPISFEKLRDTIDAMPMRRQERRNPPNP